MRLKIFYVIGRQFVVQVWNDDESKWQVHPSHPPPPHQHAHSSPHWRVKEKSVLNQVRLSLSYDRQINEFNKCSLIQIYWREMISPVECNPKHSMIRRFDVPFF